MPSRTFSIFLLFAVTCPGHCTATETVTASAGERVALPCKIPKDLILKEPLFWWRNGFEVICELTTEKVNIYEAFKGRAEVSEEKLKDGDCSLVLYNVTESDSGKYGFYKVGQKQQPLLHMDLFIKAKEPTPSLTTAHKPENLLQQTSSTSSAPDGQHTSESIIAGPVVGVVIVAVLLGIGIFCLCKWKKGRTPRSADSNQNGDASIALNNSENVMKPAEIQKKLRPFIDMCPVYRLT